MAPKIIKYITSFEKKFFKVIFTIPKFALTSLRKKKSSNYNSYINNLSKNNSSKALRQKTMIFLAIPAA